MITRSLVAFLLAAVPMIACPSPLLTVTCDAPTGYYMDDGVSAWDTAMADAKKHPKPQRKYSSARLDAPWAFKPTFVFDSDKQHVTVIWAKSTKTESLNAKQRASGLPVVTTPAARSADVVMFSRLQISAVAIDPPNAVTMFSVFPALNAAFINTQSYDLQEQVEQVSFHAVCEFSWSK